MSAGGTVNPIDEAVPTRLALFLAFLKIGVLGFGGVAAWARHVLVVERRFLTEREFAESFGLASSLPGANTVNLATMLGDRFRGVSGATAALLGLIGVPLVILVGIAVFYTHFGGQPDVKAGLQGAAAAAAGVVLGTSLKILRDLEPDFAAVLVAGGVCLAAALQVPMLLILAIAIPLSIAVGLATERRA